ncbi:hypothetical protein IWW48_003810 [Coemansia sp. RSA 1200]|nr:hypothetical protein IWW48_003810 [Coemansia sp. RSA 1200]
MNTDRRQERPVHIILRYPFKRPADFNPPQLAKAAEKWSLEEQVWRCLLSLPGPDRPQDILAELEQDEVTFDWELLATTLQVSLGQVFEAASNLFVQHLGRPLDIAEESIQFTRNSADRAEQMQMQMQLQIQGVGVGGLPVSSATGIKEGVGVGGINGDAVYASSAPPVDELRGRGDVFSPVAGDRGLHGAVYNSEPPPPPPPLLKAAAAAAAHVESLMPVDRNSSASLDLPPDAGDFNRAGLRSVESLGRAGSGDESSVSPAVNLGTATPDGGSETSRQSEQQKQQEEDDEAPHHASCRVVDSDQSMHTSSIITEQGQGQKSDIPVASYAMAESQYLQKHPAAQKNTIGSGNNSRGGKGSYAANEEEDDDQIMRQSMLAEAMGSRFEPADYTRVRRNTTTTASGIPPSLLSGQQQQQQQQQRLKQINAVSSLNGRGLRQAPNSLGKREEKQTADSLASSLSFSDLSASSLTESAMQDALLSEAMNASTTMSSILGSRVFPWSKKKKPPKKS